jgi:hypothetical protein
MMATRCCSRATGCALLCRSRTLHAEKTGRTAGHGQKPGDSHELSTSSGQLDGDSMKSVATMAEELRERIIARPDVILDDRDVMRALIAANDKAWGQHRRPARAAPWNGSKRGSNGSRTRTAP